MTQEFCQRLQQEFVPHEVIGGYRHWQFNYEQFRVKILGPNFRKPTLEEITQIAHQTLKRVKNIYVASALNTLQGVETGDMIILPGYQGRSQHALAINDMDFDGRAILFSTSWHTPYGMTNNQISRYIAFAKAFFETFGRNVPKTYKKCGVE